MSGFRNDWPLEYIRVRNGGVTLRPVRECDLAELTALLPDDAEHDPSSIMLEGLDLEVNRRRLFMQSYWSSRASWSVDRWCLMFLVTADDHTVGVQTLEANRFTTLRTVDSFSWLDTSVRGQGIGTAMRTAALTLAFDHLHAEAAVSSAREDNEPWRVPLGAATDRP